MDVMAFLISAGSMAPGVRVEVVMPPGTGLVVPALEDVGRLKVTVEAGTVVTVRSVPAVVCGSPATVAAVVSGVGPGGPLVAALEVSLPPQPVGTARHNSRSRKTSRGASIWRGRITTSQLTDALTLSAAGLRREGTRGQARAMTRAGPASAFSRMGRAMM
jgi:hypothetical protein